MKPVKPQTRATLGLSLLLIILISGCASPAPFAQLIDGKCSPSQKKLVTKQINGQIDALVKGDFKKAYSFAADSFQSTIGVNYFEVIIKAQYQVLLNSRGVSFGDCKIINQEINQNVVVTSGSKDLPLIYRLTFVNNRLGVIAATDTNVAGTVTT